LFPSICMTMWTVALWYIYLSILLCLLVPIILNSPTMFKFPLIGIEVFYYLVSYNATFWVYTLVIWVVWFILLPWISDHLIFNYKCNSYKIYINELFYNKSVMATMLKSNYLDYWLPWSVITLFPFEILKDCWYNLFLLARFHLVLHTQQYYINVRYTHISQLEKVRVSRIVQVWVKVLYWIE